jgi:hypothetical protein
MCRVFPFKNNTDFELRHAIRFPLLEHPAHDQFFLSHPAAENVTLFLIQHDLI